MADPDNSTKPSIGEDEILLKVFNAGRLLFNFYKSSNKEVARYALFASLDSLRQLIKLVEDGKSDRYREKLETLQRAYDITESEFKYFVRKRKD